MNVIVLNADYTFLNVVTPKKAFSYIARGKVVIEKFTENTFTTAEKSYKMPLIVRFTYLVRQIFGRKVPWSKKNVCIRDGHVCAYCGIKDKVKMTVDHVIPKSKGGANTFENTVASCKKCNNKKGDRTCTEVGMYPSHIRKHPTISEFMKRWYDHLNINDIIKTIWE